MSIHDSCDRKITALIEALKFYGDPASYWGIIIIPDPPCGDFSKDVSDTGDITFGHRHGALARATLEKFPENDIEVRLENAEREIKILTAALEQILLKSIPMGSDAGDAGIEKIAREALYGEDLEL